MTTIGSDRPIAVIGPHPPYRGGIAHFTERVTAELRLAGRTVVPVSFRRLYPALLFPGSSQVEAVNEDIPAAHEWIDSLNPFSWSTAAQQIIRIRPSCAVFMYWMPFFAPGFIRIARKLKRDGIRVTSVVHNAIPHERHPADTFLSTRFLKLCDSVTVLSEAVAADVRVLSPGLDVQVHPHPVYDRFGENMDEREARRLLDLGEYDKVLLFFGNVRPYKGLDVLLDAMPGVVDTVGNTVLLVAGEFYDDVETYRNKIDSSGLSAHVRLVNRYIPTNEVARYFSAADVVVQPYRSATQSGVIRTAHQFGLPVIATNVGGLADDIGAGGIVVNPADSRALSAAIIDYFNGNRKSALRSQVLKIRQESSWRAFTDALCADPGAVNSDKAH